MSDFDLDDFMMKVKNERAISTYRDYLCTIKVFHRDYLKQPEVIEDYKFPNKPFKSKILPTKGELNIFYNALSNKHKVLFLMLASSGLRVSELLNADIDKNKRMLIPQSHEGNTKRSWVSFYNEEAGALLKDEMPTIRVSGLNHTFKKVSNKTGIHIYPHLFRAVFTQEMTHRQVPDRYIDAFCGRVPSSVLARHYSDFSPAVLKEVYDKADLKFF